MNLYEELGVPSDATPEQIKSAHRKRVKDCHPDRNPGDVEAAATFRRVHHAYTVLSDPERRTRYDQTGDDGSESPDAFTANSVILSAWRCVIEEGDPGQDLLRLLERTIRHGIVHFNATESTARLAREKAEQIRSRLSVNGASSTLLSDVLDERIGRLRAQEQQAKKQAAAGEEAIEQLKGWSYRADSRHSQVTFDQSLLHKLPGAASGKVRGRSSFFFTE